MGRLWEFFRTKVAPRGRRVDGRIGESRGRSVRVKREEEGGAGSSSHSLTLSVTVGYLAALVFVCLRAPTRFPRESAP